MLRSISQPSDSLSHARDNHIEQARISGSLKAKLIELPPRRTHDRLSDLCLHAIAGSWTWKLISAIFETFLTRRSNMTTDTTKLTKTIVVWLTFFTN